MNSTFLVTFTIPCLFALVFGVLITRHSFDRGGDALVSALNRIAVILDLLGLLGSLFCCFLSWLFFYG
jgi:hypothetical protein